MRIWATVVLTVAGLVVATVPTASESPHAEAAPAMAGCAAPPPPDVSTTQGWIGYLAAHPDDYGLAITTADGQDFGHNIGVRFPTASAIKLVHLAAYAQAVARGDLHAEDTVGVDEWEQWYFPLDGGAHRESLRYLGIPEVNGVAVDRTRQVSYRQLVDVMIRFSDSAAPDVLRERLGDGALLAIMRAYGLGDETPGLLGLYLGLLDPTVHTAAQRDSAARRYRHDPAYAAHMLSLAATAPPLTVATDSTIDATPGSLHALMSAIARGTLGPGAAIARNVLEYQGVSPDGGILGFKGGSLPGILTEVFEYRFADARIAVGTLMVRGLSPDDAARNDFAHQRLLLGALTDPQVTAALRCVV
ncbi:serine hydrolase [Gordonia sp. NPDC003504]